MELDELSKEVEQFIESKDELSQEEFDTTYQRLLNLCSEAFEKEENLILAEEAKDLLMKLINRTYLELPATLRSITQSVWFRVTRVCYKKGLEAPILEVDLKEIARKVLEDSVKTKHKEMWFFLFDMVDDACKELEKYTINVKCRNCKDKDECTFLDYIIEVYIQELDIIISELIKVIVECKYKIRKKDFGSIQCKLLETINTRRWLHAIK